MWFLKIISALEEEKVRYALVGGFAVALHGAVRGTVDIDLAIAFTEESLRRAEKVFKSLGLESRLPVTASDIFKFRDEYVRNRNLIAWSFYDPKNPVQVVDVLLTEDAAEMKRIKKSVGHSTVYVASIDDLIRMKRAAGRPQDLEDIKALQLIKKGLSKE